MENKFGPIFRHKSDVADGVVAPSESLRDVEKHIETHLGKPGIVIHELSSKGVHVDITLYLHVPIATFLRS